MIELATGIEIGVLLTLTVQNRWKVLRFFLHLVYNLRWGEWEW